MYLIEKFCENLSFFKIVTCTDTKMANEFGVKEEKLGAGVAQSVSV
jgi:hypothetical protein